MSETRFLPVKLTPEEIQVIKNKVADLAVDMITWEVEMSSLKKKIGAAKEEQNVHALKLASGNEIRDIECEWYMEPELKFKKGDSKKIPNSDEKWEDDVVGVKELIRLDTYNERVEYEEMAPQDFQEQLPIDDEKEPAKKSKTKKTPPPKPSPSGVRDIKESEDKPVSEGEQR